MTGIEALCHSNDWIRWMGIHGAEPFRFGAARNISPSATAPRSIDVSPLIKYRIQGRDAARYVDHLVTRDLTKVKPMQVFYTAWCDDDGMLVEEGTLFRLAENDFILNAALHQSALAEGDRLRLRRARSRT